jgi:hypothetical protein
MVVLFLISSLTSELLRIVAYTKVSSVSQEYSMEVLSRYLHYYGVLSCLLLLNVLTIKTTLLKIKITFNQMQMTFKPFRGFKRKGR